MQHTVQFPSTKSSKQASLGNTYLFNVLILASMLLFIEC